MWLITDLGFFSIVRKPGDDDLTVRSRARADLEALHDRYLPTLGPIVEGAGTDYPFRAKVTVEDLAFAASEIVRAIDYSNFKSRVAAEQGTSRAHIYGDVWADLLKLGREEKQ